MPAKKKRTLNPELLQKLHNKISQQQQTRGHSAPKVIINSNNPATVQQFQRKQQNFTEALKILSRLGNETKVDTAFAAGAPSAQVPITTISEIAKCMNIKTFENESDANAEKVVLFTIDQYLTGRIRPRIIEPLYDDDTAYFNISNS